VAQVRKTVGVYDRPEKRGISTRVALAAIAVAVAATAGAALYFL
jgi:hypothetical protein